jgi:hypothetical protein
LYIDKIWLFRIVHINNVEYILRHGMVTRGHAQADPEYISIGDTTLISQRNDYSVKIEGYGNLGDYVPFYFGPLSPMLYNIKTGHRGITRIPQREIVYICCRYKDIATYCGQWCFTNGHAKSNITDFFNQQEDLDKVDWTMVFERMWRNNEEDYDRMRRKQAEFLVKEHVDVQCIGCIIVFNEEKLIFVQNLVNALHLEIQVRVNPDNKYYY